MPRPVLLAVDDDADLLAEVGREMEDRYGRQYEVVCLRSPADARERLAEYAASGEEVALVLAGPWLDGATGGELLREVRRLHPHAMRSLLIAWGDWGQKATGEAIFDGIAQGHFDSYVLRPALLTRRAVPPGHLRAAARLGRVATVGAVHRPHRRPVVVGPGPRAT